MSVKRQDAWTDEDDMALAEITLRHIREGGTQLSSFEEVARKLGRTPAACGFRWNSSVRKRYETAVQMAKAQRKKRAMSRTSMGVSMHNNYDQDHHNHHNHHNHHEHHEHDSFMDDVEEAPMSSLENIIHLLRQHQNEVQTLSRIQKKMQKELEDKNFQIERLERENNSVRSQLRSMQSDYRMVNDDYRMLVKIMDRARKMSILQDNSEKFKRETEHIVSERENVLLSLQNQSENEVDDNALLDALSEEATCSG